MPTNGGGKVVGVKVVGALVTGAVVTDALGVAEAAGFEPRVADFGARRASLAGDDPPHAVVA